MTFLHNLNNSIFSSFKLLNNFLSLGSHLLFIIKYPTIISFKYKLVKNSYSKASNFSLFFLIHIQQKSSIIVPLLNS